MKTFAAIVSLATIIPAVLGAPPLTINTPASVVQCQPIMLQWSGGTPRYFLSVIPGGQPSAPAIEELPIDPQSTSYSWTAVNIQAGTSITLSLKDSTGAVQYTDKFTVQPSNDSSCLNKPAAPATGGSTTGGGSSSAGSTGSTTSSGGTGSTGSSSASGSSGTSGASGASGTSAASGSSNSSTKPSGTTAPSTKPSSGASTLSVATFSLVGAMGLLGASLF